MKAVKARKYGPPEVLEIYERERPAPKTGEICIKVYAAAVTASDIFIRSSNVPFRLMIPMRLMMGIFKPRKPVLGLVFSGEVFSLGKNSTRFNIGDPVYGFTGFRQGAYAEYLCLKDSDSLTGTIALKPANISHEEATAAVYGGALALQFLDACNITRGQNVLIYGASGTTGTIAIQYAKHLGANVAAVCSTKHLKLVSELGADKVIDYTKTAEADPSVKYDVIMDAVGKMKKSAFRSSLSSALAPNGISISIDDDDLKMDSKRLNKIRSLVEEGYIKPVLSRTYPLDEIIEAHRFVEQGHKTGGVAITIV